MGFWLDTTQLLRIISGEDRRIRARCLRGLLRALVPVYGSVVGLRNRRFDAGHGVNTLGKPVISVGNITTGGTGKTPFVMWLIGQLRERKLRPALLSRGYSRGGEASQPNDEAREIELSYPDLKHLQDPDRVTAGKKLADDEGVDAILLDDGFQHRRLGRNLDIVLIDATCPFGYGSMLPAGLLREPVQSLRRADIIVLTRVEQVGAHRVAEIEERIFATDPGAILFRMRTQPAAFVNRQRVSQSISELQGRRVLAFCGIGNPRSFLTQLKSSGIEVVESSIFPDHHAYDNSDIGSIVSSCTRQKVEFAVCTEKDLVKLEGWPDSIPLLALQIEPRLERADELVDLVVESISKYRS